MANLRTSKGADLEPQIAASRHRLNLCLRSQIWGLRGLILERIDFKPGQILGLGGQTSGMRGQLSGMRGQVLDLRWDQRSEGADFSLMGGGKE